MKRLTIIGLALVPEVALAAGWSTVDASVVAMGQGGTATARSGDAAAGAYNPAAVMGRPGLSLSAGVVLAAPTLTAEGAGPSPVDTEAGLSTPPHLYAAFAGERFGVGLSVGIPYGSRVVWPAGWDKRFELISAEVMVIRVGAFAAMRFGDWSVAAGGFVDRGSLELTRAIDVIEAAGEADIGTSAIGFGGQAGVYGRPLEWLELGLSYRSRSRLAFDGYADFSVPAEFSDTTPDQPVLATVTLPDRLAMGVVVHPIDRLSVAIDLELNLWSTIDRLDIDFTAENTPDLSQPRDWSNTVTPRLGASYRALDWLTARAGLFFDPSPTPATTAGASSPDSDRLGFSVGVGAQLPAGFGVDLAYQHLVFVGVETPAGVRYGGSAELFGVSLAYAR